VDRTVAVVAAPAALVPINHRARPTAKAEPNVEITLQRAEPLAELERDMTYPC
jgi:hypothetical protein